MSTDLVAWLRAQFDEDEYAARMASGEGARWYIDPIPGHPAASLWAEGSRLPEFPIIYPRRG